MRRLLTKIKDGKISLDNVLVRQFIRDNEGQDIELRKIRKTVSDELRGYYFGAILPFLKQIEGQWKTISEDQLHEIMKKEFNYFEAWSVKNKRKERYGQPVANGKADSGKMMEFIIRIGDWVRENYGVELPNPEDYKEIRDSGRLIDE
jgi:hypothetical protein